MQRALYHLSKVNSLLKQDTPVVYYNLQVLGETPHPPNIHPAYSRVIFSSFINKMFSSVIHAG